ncbi:MAG TPA: radical SAM protein [Anaerovoracaceae bacterium]|nr:radical SAM protein [Anaerovoracaceae bacterium]
MLISWNTTKKCNLNCVHCYRESGMDVDTGKELTTEEGKKLIGEISKAGFRLLILSGGEPLLREDILELVGAAREARLMPAMGTNGTLLTREIADELFKAGLKGVAVSIDSLDEKYHDEFRGQQGAFDKTQEGIENALSAGLRVQINMTVTEKNQEEFGKLVSYYENKGVQAIHPFFLVPTGRALSMEEDSLKETAYYSMIRRVLNLQNSTALELKPTCAPQFMPMAKEMGLSQRFTKGCLAGTAYCCILPEGQVHICPYLPVEAGNVREKPLDEIWESSPVFLELRDIKNYGGACGKCGYAGICGGCRARAYYYNGSYLAEEPWCFRR